MSIWKGLLAAAAATAVARIVDHALRAAETAVTGQEPVLTEDERQEGDATVQAVQQNTDTRLSSQQRDWLGELVGAVATAAVTATANKVRAGITDDDEPHWGRTVAIGLVTFLLVDEFLKVRVQGDDHLGDYPWRTHARRFTTHMTRKLTNTGIQRLLA